MTEEKAKAEAAKLNANSKGPYTYLAASRGLAWVVQCWQGDRLYWEQS
jgi:hypothetical protein